MSFRGGCRRSKKLPDRKTVLRERSPGTQGLGKQELVRRLHGLGLSVHDDPAIQAEGLAVVERFLAHVRRLPCTVSGKRKRIEWRGHWYWVVVQAAHLKTRGSFGSDFGNVVPLFDRMHAEQQRDGAFFASRGVDPVAEARRIALEYLAAHPKDAGWLLEHANDGDVVALAKEAVG